MLQHSSSIFITELISVQYKKIQILNSGQKNSILLYCILHGVFVFQFFTLPKLFKLKNFYIFFPLIFTNIWQNYTSTNPLIVFYLPICFSWSSYRYYRDTYVHNRVYRKLKKFFHIFRLKENIYKNFKISSIWNFKISNLEILTW